VASTMNDVPASEVSTIFMPTSAEEDFGPVIDQLWSTAKVRIQRKGVCHDDIHDIYIYIYASTLSVSGNSISCTSGETKRG
jgi:hypothetical protein